MKDLSAYYEIARLITAELSETITPEEKGRLNVWLAEDERHYMRYCRIRERLKRGEGENVFRNPERVREDMEKLKKKLSGNKRRFLLSGNYFWRYGAVAVFTIGIAIGLIERPWEDRSSEMSPMAQQPACTTPLCETGPSIQVGSGIVNPNIEVSTMANGNCSATVAIANPNVAIAAMSNARGTA